MKIAFYLFITLCFLSACSKKDNPLTPPASNAIVGQWQWVDVYMYRDMYLTPKSRFDKGILTFTADGKFSDVKPDGTTVNGTYALAKSKPARQGVDSILYNPNSTPLVYYQALNNNFDFYIIVGDTLKIGGINAYGIPDNYGLTNEYVRICGIQPQTTVK